jgi:hypothetical protein
MSAAFLKQIREDFSGENGVHPPEYTGVISMIREESLAKATNQAKYLHDLEKVLLRDISSMPMISEKSGLLSNVQKMRLKKN